MKMHAVDSTNLEAIGWQTDGTLTVLFKNGQAYTYTDVPRSVYRGLLHAESKGKYLNTHIKGCYAYTKLQTEEQE